VTVIELIVAIILLTIGMLGLASVSVAVLSQMGLSGQQSIATALAASRFEQYEGRACAAITSGNETTRGVHERWVVSNVGTRARMITDSLTFTGVRGKSMRIGMTSVVSCTP
jgi:Tfp pilus assembly protein PilV